MLPPGLVARLDLARLTRISENFVDPQLRRRHSDLLFTAPLDGTDAFIYVLVEHQSRTDPLMPFRVLRYIIRIWDRYLSDHPEATRLPAVLPLVVHHNRHSWSGPTDIVDLLDLDPGRSAGSSRPPAHSVGADHSAAPQDRGRQSPAGRRPAFLDRGPRCHPEAPRRVRRLLSPC